MSSTFWYNQSLAYESVNAPTTAELSGIICRSCSLFFVTASKQSLETEKHSLMSFDSSFTRSLNACKSLSTIDEQSLSLRQKRPLKKKKIIKAEKSNNPP